VHDIAKRTAERIEVLLRQSGRFVDPEHAVAEAEQLLFADQPVLGSCYQAAAAGVELMGERAGQPSLRLVHPTAARAAASRADCVRSLAPAAAWRAEVVGTLAVRLKLAAQLSLFGKPEQTQARAAASAELDAPADGAGRQLWSVLLKKVFAVDVTVCIVCGGRMRVSDFATTPKAIARALARAGLGSRAPPGPRAPTISSAQLTLALASTNCSHGTLRAPRPTATADLRS
jgi:hypothetical protein